MRSNTLALRRRASRSCSARVNGPLAWRYWMMLGAVTGPMPGSDSSTRWLAVLTLIRAVVAPDEDAGGPKPLTGDTVASGPGALAAGAPIGVPPPGHTSFLPRGAGA